MDRKLLYKSNIMGNTAMRKNRAAKVNSDRNIRRKELFSRGRDINPSPEPESGDMIDRKLSKKAAMMMKKAEELEKKAELFRARYTVYMEEKRQRLAQEKANKKPPFCSAVSNLSVSKLAHKNFDFTAPLAAKSNSSRKKQQQSSIKTNFTNTNCSTAPILRSTKPAPVSKTARPADIKTKPTKFNGKLLHPLTNIQIDSETPATKDKAFSFNNIGSAITSTARKDTAEPLNEPIENILSPIDGITPLEASISSEEDPPKKKLSLAGTKRRSSNATKTVTASVTKRRSSNATNRTPIKENTLENSNKRDENFYVSPFVTTSRGKVSAKKELKKRDSMYKLELNDSLEESVESRRKREAIKYFHKLMADEFERLKVLCNTWESYQNENAHKFEEHCTDMINVVIGQTKLLVGGKFKVFEKLIGDCEKSIGRSIIKDLNAAQDVAPEDLEGYWNIIKLQIENVDRRFTNLTEWRNNEWQDPDEKIKLKKHRLAKSLKSKKPSKAKSSDQIRSVIMAAHREFLKNRQQNTETDQDVIFVTRGLSQNHVSTPPNKQPPAKQNTPNNIIANRQKTPHRVSTSKENRPPSVMTPVQRRLSVLKCASNSSNRRLSETPKSSASLRKSILKSERKSCGKKSVLFSDQIQYCTPDVIRTSNNKTVDESMERSLRSMELRSRKVQFNEIFSD